MNSSSGKLYDNCKMLSPEGEFMSFVSEKRAMWYVKNDLAIIQKSDPLCIKINFEPSFSDFKDVLIDKRENKCCSCGSGDNLTKHHVIPYCFRKHFPKKLKSRRSFDILPLCLKCHKNYEQKAWELKKKIAEKYNVEMDKDIKNYFSKDAADACKASIALRSSFSIPPERVSELIGKIIDVHGRDFCPSMMEELSLKKRFALIKQSSTSYGRKVVDEILKRDECLEEFINMWREHFLKNVNPRFLPESWLNSIKK